MLDMVLSPDPVFAKAVPLPVMVMLEHTDEAYLNKVRYVLGVAAMDQRTMMIVLRPTVSRRVVREVLSMQNVLVMQSLEPPPDETPATINVWGLRTVAGVFNETCLLLLDSQSDRWIYDANRMFNGIPKIDDCSSSILFREDITGGWASSATTPHRTTITTTGKWLPTFLIPDIRAPYNHARQQLMSCTTSHDVSMLISSTSTTWSRKRTSTFPSICMGCKNDIIGPPHCSINRVRTSPWPQPPPPTTTPSSNTTTICFATPVRFHSTSWLSQTLLGQTIPSIISASTTTQFKRTFYLGVEDTDPIMGLHVHNRSMHVQSFLQTFTNAIPIQDRVVMMHFPHVTQDLVFMWNGLFLRAYEDGCEWLFHITDDVDVLASPGAGMGYDQKFTSLLHNIDNLGMIGNPYELNTMPFVHRTHVEVFGGFFYSQHTKNVFCDTSLWLLMRRLLLLAGPSDLGHWINLSDENEDEVLDIRKKRLVKLSRRYTDCAVDFPSFDFYPSWDDMSPNHVIEYVKATGRGKDHITQRWGTHIPKYVYSSSKSTIAMEVWADVPLLIKWLRSHGGLFAYGIGGTIVVVIFARVVHRVKAVLVDMKLIAVRA